MTSDKDKKKADEQLKEAQEALKEAKARSAFIHKLVRNVLRIDEENNLSPKIRQAFEK